MRQVAARVVATLVFTLGSTTASSQVVDDSVELAISREIRVSMGTALEVAVLHPDEATAERAMNAAFEEAERIEALLSHYRRESPLSKLNDRARDTVVIPGELARYLRRAQRDHAKTDGAFDVTVAPLLKLYRGTAPGGATLRETLETVGAHKIEFPEPRTVKLPPRMRLDPGGDGKGVALDSIVELLRDREIPAAFLSFGESSIYGLGNPPKQSDGWTVALTTPDGSIVGRVALRDRALSISSAFTRPNESGELGQAHIVDPRSGKLVTRPRWAAVTAASATSAEVLSTGLIVEGGAGFRWLPEYEDANALVIEPDGSDRNEPLARAQRTMSPGFARHFSPEPHRMTSTLPRSP